MIQQILSLMSVKWKRIHQIGVVMMGAIALLTILAPAHASKIYVIDVHGDVWPGQASFVNENLDKAAQDGATAVVLDVDTFGGLAASAVDMKDCLLRHDKDYAEVAFVHNRALSSGSLVSLSCKYIVMAPGSVIGSAQPHPGYGGGAPDTEVLSWARTEFTSTAEFRHRNPAIARSWVTADAPIPSLGVKPGDILTLTQVQASANGYCDYVTPDIAGIETFLKISGATEVDEHMDFWQTAAQYIAQPWMTALILGIGLALIIFEMLTMHSWGLAGVIGGVAVAVVFAAHIIAGTATWVGLIIFCVGIALILFEAHVLPGHGVSVVAGLILVCVGIYYAIGGSNTGSPWTLITAIFVMLAMVVLFFVYFSRIWKRFSLVTEQRASSGFVSSADYTMLLGMRGEAVSPLRPSGTAEIDGIRYNVVTDGGFINPGTPFEVVTVQGSRIVVRELEQGAADSSPTAP